MRGIVKLFGGRQPVHDVGDIGAEELAWPICGIAPSAALVEARRSLAALKQRVVSKRAEMGRLNGQRGGAGDGWRIDRQVTTLNRELAMLGAAVVTAQDRFLELRAPFARRVEEHLELPDLSARRALRDALAAVHRDIAELARRENLRRAAGADPRRQ
jgi:hypothetical protein